MSHSNELRANKAELMAYLRSREDDYIQMAITTRQSIETLRALSHDGALSPLLSDAGGRLELIANAMSAVLCLLYEDEVGRLPAETAN